MEVCATGGFWAGMIKLTPGTRVVRFLPWFVLEMTPHIGTGFSAGGAAKGVAHASGFCSGIDSLSNSCLLTKSLHCWQIAEKVMQ